MKPKQKNTKSLSDKIADALTLKPRTDIEDDQVFGTKPQIVSRADVDSSDSEDEAAISDFRKRNVNLLSEVSKKYEGQVVSRKDLKSSEESEGISDDDIIVPPLNGNRLAEDSSGSEDDELPTNTKAGSDSEEIDSDGDGEESDDYSITKFQKKDKNLEEDEESDEEDDDDDDEGEGYDISQMDEPMKEEFEPVKKQNLSEEAKKGASVRNQLLIWEGLLEMRIHLQRCMTTANQMPMSETYTDLAKNKEFLEESNTAKSNISTVLDKLLTLQDLLLKNFPETKSLSKKGKQDKANGKEIKEESDEEIPSDTDNEEIPSDTEPEDEESTPKPMKNIPQSQTRKRKLQDFESEISTNHKAFKSFRDTSISKWNDKTRLATATNIKSAPTNTVLQQISYILSDRDKLIKRTQLKRSEYEIIGHKKDISEQNDDEVTKSRKDDDEYIPEIFDDSDFYHQLLRELIECKSADISDPVQLSRQWIALQQMRSKMKRKVDTKATKGRKIKYVVHNQLVNFMAAEKCTTWTEESTNELFNSLFGKLFERNNVGVNGDVGNLFKLK